MRRLAAVAGHKTVRGNRAGAPKPGREMGADWGEIDFFAAAISAPSTLCRRPTPRSRCAGHFANHCLTQGTNMKYPKLILSITVMLAVSVGLVGCLDTGSGSSGGSGSSSSSNTQSEAQKFVKEFIAAQKHLCDCPNFNPICVQARTTCPDECSFTANSSRC